MPLVVAHLGPDRRKQGEGERQDGKARSGGGLEGAWAGGCPVDQPSYGDGNGDVDDRGGHEHVRDVGVAEAEGRRLMRVGVRGWGWG